MLFMVIERFDPGPVGERFALRGRMLPDGVVYHASWIDAAGDAAASQVRCFQVMEAPNAAALQPWIDAWSDLGRFEIVPVQASAEFWAEFRARSPDRP